MRTPIPPLVALSLLLAPACVAPSPLEREVGRQLAYRAAEPAAQVLAGTPRTVAALHERYVRELAALDPQYATSVGIHDHDERLTRWDESSVAAREALRLELARALAALDPATLSPADALDRTLLLAGLVVELEHDRRHDDLARAPGLPLWAISSIHALLIRDFAPREVRAAHAVARLGQLPLVCADARARLGRPPLLWTQMALDDLDGALAFLDGVPELAGPTPGLDEALDAARTALVDYRDFLTAEVLPRSDGAWALGRAEYEFILRHGLLVDLDADELHRAGWADLAATEALLEQTARQIDPARGWREILAEMMEDHPSAEGLLPAYRDEAARARAYLVEHDIVPIPDETLQLVETPAFMRSTVPFAAYDPPAPLDASRLGTFYVTPEPEAHIVSDIAGTTWHEAYPGHHLQLVYSKDNPSLVRALNDSPLLSEGWGLYCEELAHETGYYDDPRERLMQLNWRLQRSGRVILDSGLHAKGWSYEQAVAFLVERVRMRPAQAEGSVKAYTERPTYFSCYLLGMLEIVRIREALRARLGERFTLSEFHRRLLEVGNVPPALIEAELARSWR